MDLAVILLKQIIMMFILAGVGYCLFKGGKISKEGSKTIGNILIYIVLPCVIVNGFITERTPEKTTALLISMAAAAILLLISMVVSRVAFRKDEIAAFAGAFSNPGFFGIPLIAAVLDSSASFYIAAFIALLNILQWTYGVSLLTGEKSGLEVKKVLKAPFMIAIIIGLILFFGGIPVPSVVRQSIQYIANTNTTLAMFVIGVYLAEVDLPSMFRRKSNYLIAAVRLCAVPLISVLVLSLLPSQFQELKLAVLIASACPVGSNVAVYAQLHGKDYPYAVETVIISTILSIVTMPLIILLAMSVW